MAANAKENIVEEIKTIILGFKQAKPLGRTFGVKNGFGGVIGRAVFKPGY
jgi:hypothetical protein